MILDGDIIYRSRRRIVNFDSISDRVANLCPRTIGRFDDLQATRFEHRHIQRQRSEIGEANVVTHQVEAAGYSQRLIVDRMNRQIKKSRLSRA